MKNFLTILYSLSKIYSFLTIYYKIFLCLVSLKSTAMSKRNNQPLAKMYCKLFGHRYKVTKQVTSHVKEYKCSCCKRELTTNSNGRLTELTPKFKEINDILERIHTTRMMRSKQKSLTSSIY